MSREVIFSLHETIPFLQGVFFFFSSAHCCTERSSSETSGREVGGSMGGRAICIFIDARAAVKGKAKTRLGNGLVVFQAHLSIGSYVHVEDLSLRCEPPSSKSELLLLLLPLWKNLRCVTEWSLVA